MSSSPAPRTESGSAGNRRSSCSRGTGCVPGCPASARSSSPSWPAEPPRPQPSRPHPTPPTGRRNQLKRRSVLPESWFGRRRRAIAGVALGAASVIVLAACGSSSPSSPSTSASSASASSAKTYTLTIGVGSPNLSYAAFWVAMANNLFAKNGVDVKVSSYNTDGQSPNLLAAHKIQLQVFGPVTAAQLDLRGQQASYLDTLSNYGPSVEAVVGAKGINTVAQLRNTKNCRIATDEVGTLPYAFSVLYQKAEKLTNCTLVITSGAPAVAAEVGAGTAQAGVETYSTALALLDAKKATLLLDPLNVPAWLKAEVAPHSYALGGVLG